jgi:hypothetical protein
MSAVNVLPGRSLLNVQLYSGWDVVITEDTGGTDFGLDFGLKS